MAVPDKENISLLEEDYTSTSCHHKWIFVGVFCPLATKIKAILTIRYN